MLMFFKSVSVSLMVSSLVLFSTFTGASKPKVQTMILNGSNFTSLVGEVNDASVTAVINDINNADPSKVFYLYIDSPGGEVIAGNRLVEFLQGTDVKVEVIAQTAASMAAVITESVKVRHMTSTGFLMFHHIQGGASGDIEQVKARVKFAEELQAILYKIVATRLGVSIEEITRLIGFEWFLNSDSALKANAIDDVVKVRCDNSITKLKKKVQVPTPFGYAEREVPVCPL